MTHGAQGRGRATRAVLFDLGGVFLDWDPRHLYRKLFGDDVAAMEYFLGYICTPEWHGEQDRGQSIALACAERRARYPGYTEMINAWERRGEEMIRGVIEGSVEVLSELKGAGVPCYVLSNMERETWQRRLGIYDFLGWFDGCFISGLEGVMKPEPDFFVLALERFGLSPTEVLFIDDRDQNTVAAAGVGIPSIVFRSAGAMREELVARGLLAPAVTSGSGA